LKLTIHLLLVCNLTLNINGYYVTARTNSYQIHQVDELLASVDSSTEFNMAIKTTESALKLSKEYNYIDGQIQAHLQLSLFNFNLRNHSESVKNAARALLLDERYGNHHAEKVHSRMSIGLESIGAFTESIHHAKKVLAIQQSDFKEHVRKNRVFHSLSRIGVLYMQLQQFDSSLVYFQKALNFSNQKNNHRLTS